MNKKQFFILSLLISPFLYQKSLHAGFIRQFVIASITTSIAMEIYLVGELNKTLPAEKQTVLIQEGHPYLDATCEMTKNIFDSAAPILLKAAEQSEKASKALQRQREKALPAFIKTLNPSKKSTPKELSQSPDLEKKETSRVTSDNETEK
jgi:hypothetical protein